MIKIRYADLPGGLHARAETRGRNTIIYLLPGLTVPQRRAALRRLRSDARMGRGPRLSGVGLARATIGDRMRTNISNAVAALRVHPGILAPPLVVTVLAAVAFVLMVPLPVSLNPPQVSSPATVVRGAPGGAPAQPPGTRGGSRRSHSQRPPRPRMPPNDPRSTMKLVPDPGATQGGPVPVRTQPPSARPEPRQTPRRTPVPSPSRTSSPSPSVSGSATGSGAASPSPSAGDSMARPQGTCVLLLLEVCLS